MRGLGPRLWHQTHYHRPCPVSLNPLSEAPAPASHLSSNLLPSLVVPPLTVLPSQPGKQPSLCGGELPSGHQQ